MSRSLFFVLLLSLTLFSCGASVVDKTAPDGAVDYRDPSLVVQAIFSVAQGGNPRTLGELCDPQKQNDADTRRICDYAGGFDPEGEFPMFFKEGKLNGPAKIEGDKAWVPFLYGPNGDKPDTMELVRRDEKWYLEQF